MAGLIVFGIVFYVDHAFGNKSVPKVLPVAGALRYLPIFLCAITVLSREYRLDISRCRGEGICLTATLYA